MSCSFTFRILLPTRAAPPRTVHALPQYEVQFPHCLATGEILCIYFLLVSFRIPLYDFYSLAAMRLILSCRHFCVCTPGIFSLYRYADVFTLIYDQSFLLSPLRLTRTTGFSFSSIHETTARFVLRSLSLSSSDCALVSLLLDSATLLVPLLSPRNYRRISIPTQFFPSPTLCFSASAAEIMQFANIFSAMGHSIHLRAIACKVSM